MGSPCLFRERYEFLPAWDVTRRCLPGGNSRRGDPSPEGGTGPAGGVSGDQPGRRRSRSASSSRPVSGSARPGGATGSRPRCGGAASRRAARPAAPPCRVPGGRRVQRRVIGQVMLLRPGGQAAPAAAGRVPPNLGTNPPMIVPTWPWRDGPRPLRWQQHRRGRDRRSGSGRHQKSAVGPSRSTIAWLPCRARPPVRGEAIVPPGMRQFAYFFHVDRRVPRGSRAWLGPGEPTFRPAVGPPGQGSGRTGFRHQGADPAPRTAVPHRSPGIMSRSAHRRARQRRCRMRPMRNCGTTTARQPGPGGRLGRRRTVCHPDVSGHWAENESVLRMEPLPAGMTSASSSPGDGGNLGCCRRSSQPGEASAGQVAQCNIVLIHPPSGFLEWPVAPRPRLPGLDARYPGPAPVA